MVPVSEHTLLCAVRYALGKPPYVTDGVIADVIRNYNDLSVDERRQIVQDIDNAISAGDITDLVPWRVLQTVVT